MTEDLNGPDGELDPNMLSTMGFASFGMQHKPKRRKPNNHSQAAGQLSQVPGISVRGEQQLAQRVQQKQASSPLALREGQKENRHGTHPADLRDAPTHIQPHTYGNGWQGSGLRQPEESNEEAGDPHYQDDASSEENFSDETRDKEEDNRRQQGQSVHPPPPTDIRPSHPLPPKPNTHPPQNTTRSLDDADGHLSQAQLSLPTSPSGQAAGTAALGGTANGKWDFGALSRGVRDQKGDLCFYRASFVEDPWKGLS